MQKKESYSASNDSDVQVAEQPASRKIPWQIIGTLLTLGRFLWEILRDLVLKK